MATDNSQEDNQGNNHDDNHDLTRIEDLSEFSHEENNPPELPFEEFIQEEHIEFDPPNSSFTETNSDLAEDSGLSEANEPKKNEDFESVNFSENSDSANLFAIDEDLIRPKETPTENKQSENSLIDNLHHTDTAISSERSETQSDVFSPLVTNLDELTTNMASLDNLENDIDKVTENLKIKKIVDASLTEIKNFAESLATPETTASSNNQALQEGVGGPPFSIILKNIKYNEDANEIRRILNEFEIIKDENKNEIEIGLSHGSLLIPQISEFLAIHLSHRFRRFDLEISMGLSDEIFHAKSSKAHDKSNENSRGLSDKYTVKQNKSETFKFKDNPVDISTIIVTTTPTLQNYQIKKYLGIVTEEKILPLENLTSFESTTNNDLIIRLKEKAYKNKGNAIVGLCYQFIPTMSEYKIIATGNVVWVEHNE